MLFPSLADTLAYVRGLKPKNLVGAAFGSYGWSGEAPAQINEQLAAMDITIIADPLKVLYVPGPDDLASCRSLGELAASKLKDLP